MGIPPLYSALFLLLTALFLSLYWLFAYAFLPWIRSAGEAGELGENGSDRPVLRCLSLILFLFLSMELSTLLSLLPSLWNLREHNPHSTSLMGYRGIPADSPPPGFIPLENVPEQLLEGIRICEDNNFYDHRGFDPASIRFALKINLKQRRFVYGGSTITQQLARTLFLTPRKTLYRKYRELILSLGLEMVLTKERILELYMNYAEWGPGVFGIYDAAHYHFGKEVGDLTPPEEAALVTILPNPLRWDTGTFTQNETLKRRWEKICLFYEIDPTPR